MNQETTVTHQEVQYFVSALFIKAALTQDYPTFTACLYRLRELYKETQINSDKESKEATK
jgi:hypothetical protein